MATSPKTAEPATPNTIRVIVHPRKSALYQVQVGVRSENGQEIPIMANRMALGGEEIEVSLQDAEHMKAHGFVADEESMAAFRGVAAELATDPKGDRIVRHTLREEVAGNYGLQRQQGASDAW